MESATVEVDRPGTGVVCATREEKAMKVSVVIPVYNERAAILPFARALVPRLRAIAGCEVEFIFVDDGSTDGGGEDLRQLGREFAGVRVLFLAFNYGHQIALVAGMDEADSDAVLTLDGDGQHPVGVAVELIEYFMANPEVDVVQAVRTGGQSGLWKNVTSRLFYALMRQIVPDIAVVPGSADFRLMSRRAMGIFRAYPDRHRNIRLLVASLPLRKARLEYRAEARLGGDSKFSFAKMLHLAMDGVFFFSRAPLRVGLFLALSSAAFSTAYFVYALIMRLRGEAVAGWTSLMGVVSLMFALVFLVQTILAEYLGRILDMVKGHPVYLVKAERPGTVTGRRSPPSDTDKRSLS
jgi:dolichol-phosphate mannosyltransferase